MSWHLCKRSCWKELTTLLHLRTLFSRLAWKKSSLSASLCAQIELYIYFMFLFLGSRVWSSRHTEDILHLPVSTLPPFLSFLCLQQPPVALLSWLQTAEWPCTPKGTRIVGEEGDTCGNPSSGIPCFWMAPLLSVRWLELHRSLLVVQVLCTRFTIRNFH